MPTVDGSFYLDRYSGSFLRAREDGLPDFNDGHRHDVTAKLATVAGPGGEVIPDVAALRALNAGATWFDDNGTLGKVVHPDGSDVSGAVMADYIEQGYVLTVQLTGSGQGTRLTIHDAVIPPEPVLFPPMPDIPQATPEPIPVVEPLPPQLVPELRVTDALTTVDAVSARTGIDYVGLGQEVRVQAVIDDVSAIIRAVTRQEFPAPVPAAIAAVANARVIRSLSGAGLYKSESIGSYSYTASDAMSVSGFTKEEERILKGFGAANSSFLAEIVVGSSAADSAPYQPVVPGWDARVIL